MSGNESGEEDYAGYVVRVGGVETGDKLGGEGEDNDGETKERDRIGDRERHEKRQ